MISTNLPLPKVAAWLGAHQIKFIMDTGAAILIISKLYITGVGSHSTNISIISANGQQIDRSGQDMANMILRILKYEFTWTFVVDKITKHSLGYDSGKHIGLLPDCTSYQQHN